MANNCYDGSTPSGNELHRIRSNRRVVSWNRLVTRKWVRVVVRWFDNRIERIIVFLSHRRTNEGKALCRTVFCVVRKAAECSKPISDSEENNRDDVYRAKFKREIVSVGNDSGVVPNAIWSCFLQEEPQTSKSTTMEERPFQCNSCERSFKRLFDLNRHDRAKHLKIGVICPLCQKRLSAVDVLRKHLKTQHPDPPTARVRGREPEDVSPPPRPAAPIVNIVRHITSDPPEEEVHPVAVSREEPSLPARPIRYLDLRPTSPEKQELAMCLERWQTAILNWPSPMDRAEVMASFDAENADLGFPARLAVGVMINVRLAMEKSCRWSRSFETSWRHASWRGDSSTSTPQTRYWAAGASQEIGTLNPPCSKYDFRNALSVLRRATNRRLKAEPSPQCHSKRWTDGRQDRSVSLEIRPSIFGWRTCRI